MLGWFGGRWFMNKNWVSSFSSYGISCSGSATYSIVVFYFISGGGVGCKLLPKMLTRDCMHIGRQLGSHYVEEKLVVLCCLHSHVFILAVSAASCTVIVCTAVSRAEMYSL